MIIDERFREHDIKQNNDYYEHRKMLLVHVRHAIAQEKQRKK